MRVNAEMGALMFAGDLEPIPDRDTSSVAIMLAYAKSPTATRNSGARPLGISTQASGISASVA
jgi:hypothetical protein